MSENLLDAAEAARITVCGSEDLFRTSRRLMSAAEALQHSSVSLGHGLLVDRAPDGHDLLTRYGAALEALAAVKAAMLDIEDGLSNLRFVFTDAPEVDARLRARALDELRLHLKRRGGGGSEDRQP